MWREGQRERESGSRVKEEETEEEDGRVPSQLLSTVAPLQSNSTLKMSPAVDAQPALESSSEAQEALAESKARSVISYSPDEIFQKSWQVREEKKGEEREIASVEKLLASL